MLQNEVLRQVLEAKGLDFEEIMREVMMEQKILNLMRTVGKSVAELIGEVGYANIEVNVGDGKVSVSISGSVRSRHIEFDLTQESSGQSQGQGKSRDGKGPQIASLLQEACKPFGIKLKEWQVRSIAFHFPQIARSLMKETNNAIAQDPNFREAINLYRQWHPERQNELPQI